MGTGTALFRPPARALVALALAALCSGLAYYALFRGANPPPWPDPTRGTWPSLAHGFATALLLLASVARPRHVACALGANLLLTATLEATLGTFDPNDLAALAVGTLAALAVARCIHVGPRVRTTGPRLLLPGLVAASAVMTIATTGPRNESEPPFSARGQPVYLSYNELRQAVRTTEPRPLEAIGRVYLYEDFLLLNARNEGVHVIDNSDPSAPEPVSFIEIPGNTELSIRDGILYADSYVDLVAIDLASFGSGPTEVERLPDVFPYDAYQNVPEGTYFDRAPDEALGVVVGVEDER